MDLLPSARGTRALRRVSPILGVLLAEVLLSAARPRAMEHGSERGTQHVAAHVATPATTGRIEGDVIVSTTLTTRRPRFRIYAEPGPGARPPARESAEIRNVVLYLRHAEAPSGYVPARAAVAQQDEQFAPHIVPVVRGAAVDFPNADDVYHNVFSLSSAKSFDLGRYPVGTSRSVVFDQSGSVQLFCHIHSDMSAVVLVLDNPYFAVPAPSGHFVIADVPPGDYQVMGWHERIKPVMRTVHVVAGETTRLNFNIPLPQGGEELGR
jgi:plastocyanin